MNEKERRAAILYLNRLYNMGPDKVLMGRMEKVSTVCQIKFEEWRQPLLDRSCRD